MCNRAVSTDLARRVQGTDEALDAAVPLDIADLPDDADRALTIVRGKLSKELSIGHTVNQLIGEATNFVYLARIFSGESVSFLASAPGELGADGATMAW